VAPVLATAVVVATWLYFAWVMLRRPKPPGGAVPATKDESKRDRRSIIGIVLQGLAYAIVWSPPRYGIARLIVQSQRVEWGMLSAVWLGVIATLMVSGVAVARSAIETLGKQWTLVATVGAGHSLITSGPYERVRHPIYTAMLLLLLGTGLAMSGWLQLLIAVLTFSIGTALRVKLEERLLAETHGRQFEAYRRSVPAILPRWR
jgi:protein-S-isoprenylcysteine O-methyltransferase Ste14